MKSRTLLLLVPLTACAPDIPQGPRPADAVVVKYDPGAVVPIVPTPTDLVKDPTSGKLVIPTLPTDSAAQVEFNRDYLGGLNGFPHESIAEVLLSGDLNPASVTSKTVLALDLATGGAPVPITATYDAAKKAIAIAPPTGGWSRGHVYAIALVGGKSGLRGAKNEDVIGSETWSLVSNKTPLVRCDDPDTCALLVDIIPSSQTDPGDKLKDQLAKAKQLEQLRAGLSPLLDALTAFGVQRADIAIAWTFSIVNAGEVTFDPANQVIPFPNDMVRANGRVNLPNPLTGQPLSAEECKAPADPQLQLTCGLNTLDGFSTLAPLVSENSNALGAVMQANLDPASLSTAVVGLLALKSDAPLAEQSMPKYTPCLNCLSSANASGAAQVLPQQLQWKLDVPLDERTTYVAYVTTGAKDDQGVSVIPNPVFALLRSAAPLIENGKSAVNILADAEAAQLEPIRLGMKPMFDALASAGIPRTSLALAFAFTTQSEASVLDQLHAFPALSGISDQPSFVMDVTDVYVAAAAASGIPIDGIDKFYVGAFLTPVAVTGPGGTLDPTQPKPQRVDFTLAIPKGIAPATGYPVTIFSHGFTRSREDGLAIANSLAKAGQATIASDVLFHGERTSCTGSKAVTGQITDDAACADPVAQQCNEDALVGVCVARNAATRNACTPGPTGDAACTSAGQGRCVPDATAPSSGKCQNADFKRAAPGAPPVISGWNIFSLTNFFATRDNLRQQVIDLAQLVRVLKGQLGAFGGVGPTLDTTKLGYVGQSLGGIEGTLFNAVSPDTTNVVLNVPGGALSQLFLLAPSFAAQKQVLLDTLAAQGIQPGTPAFDQFIAVAQWILDPADPDNLGQRLTHPIAIAPGVNAPSVNRRTFLQFIEGDQTVPNLASFALVTGANRAFVPMTPSFGCMAPLFCYEFTQAGDGFDEATAPAVSRHGFLLQPPGGTMGPALTMKAQMQAAAFIATGALP